MLTQDKLDEICSDLQGTCKSLEDILEWHDLVYEDLTPLDFHAIDNVVFLCEVCGWWCEVGDYAEDLEQTCSQCGEDEE